MSPQLCDSRPPILKTMYCYRVLMFLSMLRKDTKERLELYSWVPTECIDYLARREPMRPYNRVRTKGWAHIQCQRSAVHGPQLRSQGSPHGAPLSRL
jgi:hypothetical protein